MAEFRSKYGRSDTFVRSAENYPVMIAIFGKGAIPSFAIMHRDARSVGAQNSRPFRHSARESEIPIAGISHEDTTPRVPHPCPSRVAAIARALTSNGRRFEVRIYFDVRVLSKYFIPRHRNLPAAVAAYISCGEIKSPSYPACPITEKEREDISREIFKTISLRDHAGKLETPKRPKELIDEIVRVEIPFPRVREGEEGSPRKIRRVSSRMRESFRARGNSRGVFARRSLIYGAGMLP